MTGIRRALLVAGLVVAVLIGGGLPAQAAFQDSPALPTMTIGTLKVAAPTGVSTNGTRCTSTWNSSTGTWVSTLQAKISWTASSTTRGVTGYLVTAVFSDGSRYPAAQVDAGTTSVSGSYDIAYASQNIRVTVTTLTGYGWTAESAVSGVVKC